MATAVVIPSRGRPGVLHDTLTGLAAQTRAPRQVIVAITDVASDLAPATRSLPLHLQIEVVPPGVSAQRNHALRRLADDIDTVAFFDDDVELAPRYLEAIEAFFGAYPDLALVTGEVLADGARTGGLPRSEARRIVAADVAAHKGHEALRQAEPVERAYGCNMAVPRAVVERVGEFDETMPAYAWIEDLDFSYRCARHGRVAICRDARMVHLGHASSGRRSGVHFGFTEIMNPFYLWRKGTLPRLTIVLGFWLRCAKNAGLSVAGRDRDYRRARLRGNLIAFGLILRGRVDPAHVLALT